jgi:CBS domain-containing protein
MKIRDVMTSDVATVGTEAPLTDVARMLSDYGVSGVPVIDREERLRGVITEADLGSMMRPGDERGFIGRLLRRPGTTGARTAGEAMTSPPVTAGPDEPVTRAASLMAEHAVNSLPVVVDGRLVGVVSRADLVQSLGRTDHAIAEELEETLRERFLVPPGTVAAIVANGHVSLEGELDSRENAELLEWAVGEIPGVRGVTARLTWRSREQNRA